MDRLSQLADDLARVLSQLHEESACRDLGQLQAPLAWLDEANSWLRHELRAAAEGAARDPVPFAYIPADLRR